MSDDKMAMFGDDRLLRIARALRDEACYESHGFLPADAAAPPADHFVRAARVALLATEGDDIALAKLRAERTRRSASLLVAPDRVAEDAG